MRRKIWGVLLSKSKKTAPFNNIDLSYVIGSRPFNKRLKAFSNGPKCGGKEISNLLVDDLLEEAGGIEYN